MSKKKAIKLTDIKKVLSESVFDPNLIGPLSAIVQAHFDDPSYLESRAIEMIGEAKLAKNNLQYNIYQDNLTKAISLLALSRQIIKIKELKLLTPSELLKERLAE